MGLFDFMNEPVSGYTTQQAEPIAEGQEFGQGGGFKTANSNISWGQLLALVASMSNTSGGQALGAFGKQQHGAVGSGLPNNAKPEVYNIGPTQTIAQPKEQRQTSISEVAEIAGFFA